MVGLQGTDGEETGPLKSQRVDRGVSGYWELVGTKGVPGRDVRLRSEILSRRDDPWVSRRLVKLLRESVLRSGRPRRRRVCVPIRRPRGRDTRVGVGRLGVPPKGV